MRSLGEHGIEMDWRIGDLAAGQTAATDHTYVFGDRLLSVTGGGVASIVPELASVPQSPAWTILLIGFAGIGLACHRRSRGTSGIA